MSLTLTRHRLIFLLIVSLAALLYACTSPQESELLTYTTPADFDPANYYSARDFDASGKGAAGDTFRLATIVGGKHALIMNVTYPEEAQKKNATGRVVARVYLGADGEVHYIKILKTPDPVLSRAMIQTILKTSFRPGTLNGKPVKSTFTVPVLYRQN